MVFTRRTFGRKVNQDLTDFLDLQDICNPASAGFFV